MQASTRDLTNAPNRLIVSVGVATRTEIDVQTVGAVEHVERGDALASDPNPSFMAGGERHVQRETVKALGESLGSLLTPGRQVRHLAAPGLSKPSTERTIMNISVSRNRNPESGTPEVSRRTLLASVPAAAVIPVTAAAAIPSHAEREALPSVPTRLELHHYAAFLRLENQRVSEVLGIPFCGSEIWELGGGYAYQATLDDTDPISRALPILRMIDAPILRGDLHLHPFFKTAPDVTHAVENHLGVRNGRG